MLTQMPPPWACWQCWQGTHRQQRNFSFSSVVDRTCGHRTHGYGGWPYLTFWDSQSTRAVVISCSSTELEGTEYPLFALRSARFYPKDLSRNDTKFLPSMGLLYSRGIFPTKWLRAAMSPITSVTKYFFTKNEGLTSCLAGMQCVS